MTNDDERREVARRLREVQSDVIPGTKTEVLPIAGRIIGVACGYDLPDFQGLLGLLADLIEPEPEGTARLEYDEVHGCNICTGCGERYKHGMYMAVTYDDFIAYKPMRYCPACGARLEGVVR